MPIASRISGEIANQRYELVRDRIAEIINAELVVQKAAATDPITIEVLEEYFIFAEGFRAVNDSQMPAITISNCNMDFDNPHPTSSRNSITFYLDFFGREFSNQNDRGDKKTAVHLQRFIGIVRAILANPSWIRLGFDLTLGDVFVNSAHVRTVRRMDEVNTRDAGDVVMYRMLFEVVVIEDTATLDSIVLGEHLTDIQFEDTAFGYQYKFIPA